MARFLSVTPTYNPFTMDEMLKIPLLYDANFREVEKQYNELQDKAALLRLYAKDSPEIQAAIDAYDNSMKSVADAIATGKFDANMSNQARTMRDIYRTNIIPMSVAAQQYENYMQNYLKTMDGTEIGEKPSIKWFMEHPGSTPEVVHGSAIQNQLAKLIGNYASTRQINSEAANNWKPIMGGQYYGGWTGSGFTDEEIADYFNNPNSSNYSTINNIVNNFKQNIGYNNMTPEQQATADSYINTAVQIGMAGNRKYERIQNRVYKNTYVGGQYNGEDPLEKRLNMLLELAGNPKQNGGRLYQAGGSLNEQQVALLKNMTEQERQNINAIQDPNKRAGALRMYLAKQYSPSMKTAVESTLSINKPNSNIADELLKQDFKSRKQGAEQDFWKSIVNDLPYKSVKGLTKSQRKELSDYLDAAQEKYVAAFQNPVSGIPLVRYSEPVNSDVEDAKVTYNVIENLEPYIIAHNEMNKGSLKTREEKAKNLLTMLGETSYDIDYNKNDNIKALQKVTSSKIKEFKNKYKYNYSNFLELTQGGTYKLKVPENMPRNVDLNSADYYANYNINKKNTIYDVASQNSNLDVLKVFQDSLNKAIDRGRDSYNPKGRDKFVKSNDDKLKIQRVQVSARDLIDRKLRYTNSKGTVQSIYLDQLLDDRISSTYDTWADRLKLRYGLTNYDTKQALTYLDNVGVLGEEMNDFVLELQNLLGTTKNTPMPTESQILKNIAGYTE